MAEWSIAAVLKTVELRGSGGSNPSLSANSLEDQDCTNDTQICTRKGTHFKVFSGVFFSAF